MGQLIGADQRPTWSAGGRATPEPPPHTDAGPSLKRAPVVHAPGSAASVVWELVSTGEPPPQQRSRNRIVPVPLGERIAIQYVVPPVMDVAGTDTSFQEPATGAFSVPCREASGNGHPSPSRCPQ